MERCSLIPLSASYGDRGRPPFPLPPSPSKSICSIASLIHGRGPFRRHCHVKLKEREEQREGKRKEKKRKESAEDSLHSFFSFDVVPSSSSFSFSCLCHSPLSFCFFFLFLLLVLSFLSLLVFLLFLLLLFSVSHFSSLFFFSHRFHSLSLFLSLFPFRTTEQSLRTHFMFLASNGFKSFIFSWRTGWKRPSKAAAISFAEGNFSSPSTSSSLRRAFALSSDSIKRRRRQLQRWPVGASIVASAERINRSKTRGEKRSEKRKN